MRVLRLLALLPLALLGACPASPPEAASAPSPQVAFWRGRIDRDAWDYVARVRLANALMAEARATDDHAGYPEAELQAREALKIAPESAEAHVALAFALSAQHRFADARAAAERALEIAPDDAGAWAALGDALLESGDADGAARAYDRVAEADRGLFALSRAANVAAARGKLDDAVALLVEAAEVGESRGLPVPEWARCRVLAGDTEYQRGRWDEAESHYLRALEAWPDGTLPLEHLAELRASQGRLEESRDLYRRATATGSHPDLLAALAAVCADLGDEDEAARLNDEALAAYRSAVDSGDLGFLRHLALHLCDEAGRPAEALPFAERDAKLRPGPESSVVLAWVRHRTGDREGALRDVEAAVAAGAPAPATGTDTLWRGGMILDEAGDARGRAWLLAALERNPRHEHRDEIVRRTSSPR